MSEFAWTTPYARDPAHDQIRHDHREYPRRFPPDDRGDGPTLWVLEFLNYQDSFLNERPVIGAVAQLDTPASSSVASEVDLRRLTSRLRKSIRWSFFAGIVLIAAALAGFWFGGVWIGIAFVPGIIAAYGLFLSSGSQLEQLERRQ